MPSERRSRKGVEIARVGTFPLSTGEHTFTKGQLASAVAKFKAGVRVPRIGIGHIDPRFNPPGNDGDPAFGRILNMELIEDGNAVVGDYDGMAPWLDDNIEVAYPGRSIEARVNGDDMEITAVKLLGTTPPGISTLKDLATAIAASVAEGETSEADAHVAIRTLWAGPAEPSSPATVPVPPAIPTPKEPQMDPKILRTSLGLAEDASDDDVTAKLTEFAARPTPEAVTEQVEAAAEKAKTDAIAASAADDAVKVDPATFAALKASAEQGAEARTILANRDRDSFIAASVQDGRFPPSRVEHYTKRYDSDPEGTRSEIEGLEKGVVPVSEIGASTGPASEDTIITTGLFPQLEEATA